MAWETIDNLKPKALGGTPPHGVSVAARVLGTRGGGVARYIAIRIGAKLAAAVKFHLAEQRVHLMFGSDIDAGKIAVAMDAAAGKFVAKRQKSGDYALTIGAASAEGLFALEFPRFTIERCEAVLPQTGQPPRFVFKATDEMLAVDDD